jgi:hypothetical protein
LGELLRWRLVEGEHFKLGARQPSAKGVWQRILVGELSSCEKATRPLLRFTAIQR